MKFRPKVEWEDTSALRVNDANARIHSKMQVKKIGGSINAYGFTNPLLVDEQNNVLAGHGRLEAAIAAGIKEVPVIRIRHLNELEKRGLMLADNRIAAESTWDKVALRSELAELVDFGFDTELTGFDTLEIDNILTIGQAEAPGNDNVELPGAAAPISQIGDLWYIGKHRLLCADARDRESYERLLGDEVAALVFTDPPFGCRIANNVSGLGKVKHEDFVMGAGEQSLEEFSQTILRPAFRNIARYCASGAIAFVCTDWRALGAMQDAALGVFHEQKNLIVWVKTNAGMGTFYRSGHELILAYKVTPGKHQNNFGLGEGGRHRSNVWTYTSVNTFANGRLQDLADHPTVKPKKLVADAILDCSKRGAIVLDPFLGSGTTLVACEMTGRVGRGIELDPKYVDVILRRVAEETGCEPLLDGVTPLSVVTAQRKSEEG